jgi:hypothetical protein
VWGSEFTTKAATLQGGGVIRNRAQLLCMWALVQLLPAPAFRFTRYLIVVPSQAVIRGGARCASQVLGRCGLGCEFGYGPKPKLSETGTPKPNIIRYRCTPIAVVQFSWCLLIRKIGNKNPAKDFCSGDLDGVVVVVVLVCAVVKCLVGPCRTSNRATCYFIRLGHN